VLALWGCDAATPEVSGPPPARRLLDIVPPVGVADGSLAARRAAANNELSEPRAQLGRRLFFERMLSSSRQVSCATCHIQERSFSDGRAVSLGVDGRRGMRNAPALVNLAWSEHFFWDGRAATLEELAGQPIENPDEMNLPLPEAIARLAGDPTYGSAFAETYGGPPTEQGLREAIASFLATLVSGDSAYDRHLRGDDRTFAASERRGEAVFMSDRVGCFRCHPVGLLTNDGFFNDGSYVEGGDVGRQMVTGRTGDRGKFKVPGLRNVELSGPYMHDGSVNTLEEVVEQYDRGGRGDATTDPQIGPIGLSATERDDLLAFLRSFTDRGFVTDERYERP
jgi:cytochrome c peroxidase